MPYEMVVALHVVDEAGYGEYRKAMTPLLEESGGGFRYDFIVSRILKAEASHPINRVFAIYFPDKTAKEMFFARPDYLAIRRKFFDASVPARTTIAEYTR